MSSSKESVRRKLTALLNRSRFRNVARRFNTVIEQLYEESISLEYQHSLHQMKALAKGIPLAKNALQQLKEVRDD